MSTEKRLSELIAELPSVPRPIPSFVPWRRHGPLVFLAAQNCVWNGEVVCQGKVGREINLAQGAWAARICALNLVAALREAAGGKLDQVASCVRVGGYVNCFPDFPATSIVADGASQFICELLGHNAASHVLTAIGVAQLPLNASVAVDAIFKIIEADITRF